MAEAGELVKSLAPEVMKRLEALQSLARQHQDRYLAFVAERKELERKYLALFSELYAQRKDIVTGVVDPADAADKPKGIEGFWLQCLNNQPRIGKYIEEHDEPALKCLTDITLEYIDDFQGFRLNFHFTPNAWFEDSVLTKTFTIPDMFGGSRMTTEPTVEKVTGCTINWKPGKDLTTKEVKTTTKKKGKKVTKTSHEPQDSFFTFFETVDLDEEPENMEEALAMQEQIQADMTIGFTIRNKIIPRATDWFTGEAIDDESDDEDEDYEGEDEDGDDDDDDEDEEDEDDGDARPQKGKHAGHSHGGGGGGKGKGGKGRHDEDDEDDDEEDDDEDKAALASAFKKGVKLDGKKGGKDKSAGGDKDKSGGDEKPPECKQQ